MRILFAFILGAAVALGGAFFYLKETLSIDMTVIQVRVDEGLSADEVEESIMSKAAELNMKFVGHQPLSTELNNRGVKSGTIDIFQFCNPPDARKMIDFNMTFAAYMPCRIILVEDPEGRLWLEMVDLQLMIDLIDMPPDVLEIANRVNGTLLAIMDAGATGDF